jgi:hypothetical protein
MTDPKVRNCYCGLWQKDPEFFVQRGIPEGFCGICDRCGKPGHMRHYPGAPGTGAWCDRCYRFVAWFGSPLKKILWVMLLTPLAMVVYAVYTAMTR